MRKFWSHDEVFVCALVEWFYIYEVLHLVDDRCLSDFTDGPALKTWLALWSFSYATFLI